MQLVIEIPDAVYEIFNSIDLSNKHWNENYYVYGIAYSLLASLQNGQPLPKGHGNLIDVDCLIEDFKASEKISFADRMDISCIVDHAKPIIEADKEGDGE